MTDHDALISRLHDLGSAPIDSATASQHLTAVAVAPRGRDRKWLKAKVAGFLAAGVLVGGTGLASAGALPDAVQDKVSTLAAKVGLNLPKGTARYSGAECGVDANGEPIEWRNHGQYMKSLPKDQRAAAEGSKCGKPLASIKGDDADTGKPVDSPEDPNACKQAGKGRGNGHASAKGVEKANPRAKEKAGALDGSEPAAAPGKPACVEDNKPQPPVGGKAGDTDDPPPADDGNEGTADDTSGRPDAPAAREDNAARDEHGRSLDDAPPPDDTREGDGPSPDGVGGPPADDPANPYDDPEPTD